MKCENCSAELNDDVIVCPECGKPVPHTFEGFDNAIEIQQVLKTLRNDHGDEALGDVHRFIGLIKDMLPDRDRERRLLINAVLAGAFKFFLDEENPNIAVLRSRTCIIDECYVTNTAADFAVGCFAYMMDMVFDPAQFAEETEKPVAAPVETEEEDDEEEAAPLRIDSKVFGTLEAARFRLAGTVTIPEGYSSIAGFCFNGFGLMRTVKLPSTLMGIGEYAFSECKRLKGVELPARLKKLGRGAFSQCSKLAVIKIPAGVLEIDDDAFSYCDSLEVVEIPDTVSSIGDQAFLGCEKLRKLFLPESVKYIGTDAFAYCEDITIRCYENSYVHKYCLKNEITAETVVKGVELTEKIIEEG